MAVTTDPNTEIYGSAAVDCDAADRALTIQWTMSVSAGTDETVCDGYSVELM